MEIVAGWFILSAVAGLIASSRGRWGFGYFMLSVVLSPLVGGILALALPSKSDAPQGSAEDAVGPKTHVRCPDCRELVRADATKCKHCQTKLIPQKL